MAKEPKSYRLSDEAKKQLAILAKEQDRSEAYIIEKLILATIPVKPVKKKAKRE